LSLSSENLVSNLAFKCSLYRYNTVSSGAGATASVIAVSPSGLTISDGGSMRLVGGVATATLNLIGPTAEYELVYRLVGTQFDAQVRPAAVALRVGACFPGEYFDGLVCQACRAGTYHKAIDGVGLVNLTSPTTCEPCPVGTYSEPVGGSNSTCTLCPAGTAWGDVRGDTSLLCQSCDTGTFSAPGAASCARCEFHETSNKANDGCDLHPAAQGVFVGFGAAVFAAVVACCCLLFKPGDIAGAKIRERARKLKQKITSMRLRGGYEELIDDDDLEKGGKGGADVAIVKDPAVELRDIVAEASRVQIAVEAVASAAKESLAIADLLTALAGANTTDLYRIKAAVSNAAAEQKQIVAAAAGASDAAAIAAVQSAVTAICFAASGVAAQVAGGDRARASKLAVLLVPSALARCAALRAAAAGPDIVQSSLSNNNSNGDNNDDIAADLENAPDEEAADIADIALAAAHLEVDRAFLKAANKVEPSSYMSEADYANAVRELERSAANMHAKLDADAAKRREATRLRVEACKKRRAAMAAAGVRVEPESAEGVPLQNAAEEAAAAALKAELDRAAASIAEAPIEVPSRLSQAAWDELEKARRAIDAALSAAADGSGGALSAHLAARRGRRARADASSASAAAAIRGDAGRAGGKRSLLDAAAAVLCARSAFSGYVNATDPAAAAAAFDASDPMFDGSKARGELDANQRAIKEALGDAAARRAAALQARLGERGAARQELEALVAEEAPALAAAAAAVDAAAAAAAAAVGIDPSSLAVTVSLVKGGEEREFGIRIRGAKGGGALIYEEILFLCLPFFSTTKLGNSERRSWFALRVRSPTLYAKVTSPWLRPRGGWIRGRWRW
jgi:hypothetical protein